MLNYFPEDKQEGDSMIRMNKRYTPYYKAVSFTMVFIILLSMFTPIISIIGRADDKPVVTQTENQTIHESSAMFLSGAKNMGTAEDPEFVWDTSENKQSHEFVY